jgi:hypothetical protein
MSSKKTAGDYTQRSRLRATTAASKTNFRYAYLCKQFRYPKTQMYCQKKQRSRSVKTKQKTKTNKKRRKEE